MAEELITKSSWAALTAVKKVSFVSTATVFFLIIDISTYIYVQMFFKNKYTQKHLLPGIFKQKKASNREISYKTLFFNQNIYSRNKWVRLCNKKNANFLLNNFF